MKNILRFNLHMVFILIIISGCTQEKKKENSSIKNDVQAQMNQNPDCVEFIALWAASDIAERIGKDKKWVFLNYTVELWDTPPTQGSGNSVGLLRASSYARIIEKNGDDYKVESPVDKVHGWVNKEHVKSISKKNPKTRALCE